MAELYPQESSIESREGDAVHWGGAELLRGGQIDVGLVASNGVTLSEEMCDTATQYAEYIMHRECDSNATGHIEEAVANSPLHALNYGTPDYWSYHSGEHHLYIDDLKNGHGFVSEVRNWQLINYAALVSNKLGFFGDNSLKVTLTIHQPRTFHRRGPHRSESREMGDFRLEFSELQRAFTTAMYPGALVIASDPDQCKDCPGRHVCEAAIAAGYWGVDMAYDSTPLVMTPAALSREYRTLKRAEKFIKARREGIEESIKSAMRRGQAVPFFGMAHTKGRTVWRADAIEQGIIEVGAAMNINLSTPKLITPLQAIKAGIPIDVVTMYSEAPGGAVELVELDANEAARVFGQ
jgi:hypothetical protein